MAPSWQRFLARLRGVLPLALPYLPAAVVSAVLARTVIAAVLEGAGHPAVTLDDAFIHFTYARNLAHGQFFTYSPGDGYTAGATSLLWPALLAPFHWVLRDPLSIIWVTWVLGFAAHAALIVETFRLASGLTGRATAIGAAAMTALFGGFLWFAASGMETVPLAWLLTRTARIASEWTEGRPEYRTRRRLIELMVLGAMTPLMRPEGLLASLMAAAALVAIPTDSRASLQRRTLPALVPLSGNLISPLLNLLMTGSASSNTMAVKWLPLSPYHPSVSSLWWAVRDNISVLVTTLLDGEQWSALFIPKGAAPFALAGLLAIAWSGWRTNKPWRAVFVLALALGILIPTTYMSFLWNRLRYLWPFAAGWFVGIACLARLMGELAARIRPGWVAAAPVLSGLAAGTLGSMLPWAFNDVAKSAKAIDKQQVALGRWAAENLPSDAVIGVNDTGAIAYFSGRKTFDVVGLTTRGEARYWVAGAGSRFEHYERLVASSPERFPTHFIVYPGWLSLPPLLGAELHEATVLDQTILGGVTMVVAEARRELLGSGSRPLEQPLRGTSLDELDVADLESESEHAYEYWHGTGNETSNVAYEGISLVDGHAREWVDGGRLHRAADRFHVRLEPGRAARGIARLVGPGEGPASVTVGIAGEVVAILELPASRSVEVTFDIPARLASSRVAMELSTESPGGFGSLHYWFESAPDRTSR